MHFFTLALQIGAAALVLGAPTLYDLKEGPVMKRDAEAQHWPPDWKREADAEAQFRPPDWKRDAHYTPPDWKREADAEAQHWPPDWKRDAE